jgi:hypothetical protein
MRTTNSGQGEREVRESQVAWLRKQAVGKEEEEEEDHYRSGRKEEKKKTVTGASPNGALILSQCIEGVLSTKLHPTHAKIQSKRLVQNQGFCLFFVLGGLGS